MRRQTLLALVSTVLVLASCVAQAASDIQVEDNDVIVDLHVRRKINPSQPNNDRARGERFPPGNYHMTCQECNYQQGVLSCECRRIDGTWKVTRLDYKRQCPGDTLQNINGSLRCD